MTAPPTTPEHPIFQSGQAPQRPVRRHHPIHHSSGRTKSRSSLEGMMDPVLEDDASVTFCDSSLSSSWTYTPLNANASSSLASTSSRREQEQQEETETTRRQEYKLVATILFEQETAMEEREDSIMEDEDYDNRNNLKMGQANEEREEEQPEDTDDDNDDIDSDTNRERQRRDSASFFLSGDEPYYLMIPSSAMTPTGNF